MLPQTRLFYSLYQLKAVRAGDLSLSRGNGNFVTGKLGYMFSYISRKPRSLTYFHYNLHCGRLDVPRL